MAWMPITESMERVLAEHELRSPPRSAWAGSTA